MKILKSNSKKAIELIRLWNNCKFYDLQQIYGKYSIEKFLAFVDCRNTMIKEDGFDMRIISHNTFGFTVMWKTSNGYRVETPKSSYRIIEIESH